MPKSCSDHEGPYIAVVIDCNIYIFIYLFIIYLFYRRIDMYMNRKVYTQTHRTCMASLRNFKNPVHCNLWVVHCNLWVVTLRLRSMLVKFLRILQASYRFDALKMCPASHAGPSAEQSAPASLNSWQSTSPNTTAGIKSESSQHKAIEDVLSFDSVTLKVGVKLRA